MRDLARVLADLTEGLAAGRSLLLQALAESLRVRLGVLSRRALADLRVRVGVPGLICAGCHGLETDELAFEALAGKAITIRVGSERSPSAAVYGLPDVTDVQRLLSALAAEVRREM